MARYKRDKENERGEESIPQEEKEVDESKKERIKALAKKVPNKKKKGRIREYDPEKDDSCLIIGGYSSYIKKKDVIAQNS